MIDEEFSDSLLKKHSHLSMRKSVDCLTLECSDKHLVSFLTSLKTDEGFELLVDLTAIDHGEGSDSRFSTVIHLYSLVHRGYIRVHSSCLNNDEPVMPSVSSVYPAANWHERETFDMFGIRFSDHPNLKRMLLDDDWEGHPLRKKYKEPDYYHGVPVPKDKSYWE